jgi:resuscitation-promoting factor RpfB
MRRAIQFSEYRSTLRALKNLTLIGCVGIAGCAGAQVGGGEVSQPDRFIDTLPTTTEAPTSTTVPESRRSATSKRVARKRPPTQRATRSASSAPVTGDVFDALAQCESGGDPRKNTGNGYYGAFQFKLSTWRGLGMSGNPIDHSYAVQKAAAQRLVARAGFRSQFPGCSRKLGLR